MVNIYIDETPFAAIFTKATCDTRVLHLLCSLVACVRARAFDCAHIICTKFQMRTTKTSMILDEDFRLKPESNFNDVRDYQCVFWV